MLFFVFRTKKNNTHFAENHKMTNGSVWQWGAASALTAAWAQAKVIQNGSSKTTAVFMEWCTERSVIYK
jgi:hypothetical protein